MTQAYKSVRAKVAVSEKLQLQSIQPRFDSRQEQCFLSYFGKESKWLFIRDEHK
jgi:hypothetical protein